MTSPHDEPLGALIDAATDGLALLGPDGRCLRVNPAVARLTGRSEDALLAGTLADVLHPDDRDAEQAAREALLGEGDPERQDVRVRIRRPDESESWALVALAAVRNRRGATVRIAAEVRDLGEMDRLERRVRALEATTDISRAFGRRQDLGDVLQIIAERGRELLDARTLTVSVRQGGDFVIAAAAGQDRDRLIGQRRPLALTLSAQVVERRAPIHLHPAEHPEWPGHALGVVGVRSILAAPLLSRGDVIGSIAAIDHLGPEEDFTAEQELLLESFAGSAAAAVTMAQSVAAGHLRDLIAAQERERIHWARELHDDTLQQLAALSLDLASLSGIAVNEDVREGLLRAAARVSEQVKSLRGLITDLRPADLDEIGLGAALQTLAARAAAASGVSVDLDADPALDEDTLDREMQTACYRLVQEALTNITKHANARRAVVEVGLAGDRILLDVRDDGRGFDPTRSTPGFGLAGMRERLELLGGYFDVASSDRGTRIHAEIPIPAPVGGNAPQQAA